MDKINFTVDKQQLLQTLTRYDGNVTVEDVVDSAENKFHDRNYHTFFLHVLLENVCNDIEPNEKKREHLFKEVCKRLSGSKFLNAQVVLDSLLPLRRKLAQQFFNYVRQIHVQVVPDPTQNCITADTFLEENDFSTKLQLQYRYQNTFEELKEIGEGGFGVVYKARDKVTDIIYAVKKIIFKYKSDAMYLKIIREAKSIAALNHPNIVSYNSAWIECLPLPGCQSESSSSSSSNSEYGDSTECNLRDFEEDLSDQFQMLLDKENVTRNSYNRTFTTRSTSKAFSEKSMNEINDVVSFNSSESIIFKEKDSWNASDDNSGNGKIHHECAFVDSNWNPNCLNVEVMLCIQMEYCDCDLRLWLDNRAEGKDLPFQMGEIEIFQNILNGVAHIHSKNIIHRDLKPQNIFFSKSSNILKIGDFGLATLENCTSGDGKDNFASSHSANLGTVPYAAPEQRKENSYDSKVDIYSLGIILIELLMNFSTRMEFQKGIAEILEGNFPSGMKKKWPKCINLVKLLTKENPKDRPHAKDIFNLLQPLLNSKSNEIDELKKALSEKEEEIKKLKALVEEQQSIKKALAEKEEEIKRLKVLVKEQQSIINQHRLEVEH